MNEEQQEQIEKAIKAVDTAVDRGHASAPCIKEDIEHLEGLTLALTILRNLPAEEPEQPKPKVQYIGGKPIYSCPLCDHELPVLIMSKGAARAYRNLQKKAKSEQPHVPMEPVNPKPEQPCDECEGEREVFRLEPRGIWYGKLIQQPCPKCQPAQAEPKCPYYGKNIYGQDSHGNGCALKGNHSPCTTKLADWRKCPENLEAEPTLNEALSDPAEDVWDEPKDFTRTFYYADGDVLFEEGMLKKAYADGQEIYHNSKWYRVVKSVKSPPSYYVYLEAQAEPKKAFGPVLDWWKQNLVKDKTIAAQQAALKKYGSHMTSCHKIRNHRDKKATCTCGLKEALNTV